MNKNFLFKTKMFLLLCMLIPFAGISQTKNLISTNRVFPKVDKVLEFEKALAAHAQKYHTGTVRGNLGADHNLDWNKNVAIYLTERGSTGYSVYQDSLSTVALGDFSDKINIAHIYPKVGKGDNVVSIIKKLKKTWMAAGVTVAVYVASSSGKAQYTLVTRYKQGLKERAAGFRKPFKETYEAVHGEGSYAQYLKDVAEYIDESWSELLFMRADLSSK